ncbi:MAG TPA: GNAT family N-acetyltransferase [Ktedonobacterales bacterium]
MTTLPDGFTMRHPTFADLEAVTQLIAAYQLATLGEAEITAEELRAEWSEPGHDLATDAWLVAGPDGALVAIAELWHDHHIQFFGGVRVLPEAQGKGIGTHLSARWEARARELSAHAPDGVRVVLNCSVAETNAAAHALLEARGFSLVRHFWMMRVEMAAPPAAPAWPAGIALRPFAPERDARAVFAALDEAFSDHWGHLPMEYAIWEHFALQNPDFDPTLMLVAWDGDQVAGVANCGREANIGWVHQLAVRRPWRKRGLGRALLLYAFGAFYGRGERAVGLGVDAQNLTGALRLYEGAGMRPTRQMDRFQKELRAGKELATSALAD